MAAFRQFARKYRPRKAEALYILGDLFDYWAGDDDLEDPFYAPSPPPLQAGEHGTRIYLLHGNRDLLMGETLANACHATLLNDPALLDLYGTPTLLSHGDMLCTDDEYQRYRVQVHQQISSGSSSPSRWRNAKPTSLNCANAVAEKQSKDRAIMDVDTMRSPPAARTWLSAPDPRPHPSSGSP